MLGRLDHLPTIPNGCLLEDGGLGIRGLRVYGGINSLGYTRTRWKLVKRKKFPSAHPMVSFSCRGTRDSTSQRHEFVQRPGQSANEYALLPEPRIRRLGDKHLYRFFFSQETTTAI